MSSEAAQKAYPVNVGPMSSGFVDQLNQSRQEAFDAGAVEALRQAAAELDASAEWVEGSFIPGPNSSAYAGHTREAAERLRQMADEWEAGQ